MAFYSQSEHLPERFADNEFLIRPLRVTDVEADFNAVIESREMLRVWSQSDWPSDNFSLDDNRSDLQAHQDEHESREAFTFTVLDPESGTCLGCIYIHELKRVLQALGAADDVLRDIEALDAYVTFWVRSSQLEDGLDQRLFTVLQQWFLMEWAFEHITWGTNTADLHQQELFLADGLKPKWRLPMAESLESHVLYSDE